MWRACTLISSQSSTKYTLNMATLYEVLIGLMLLCLFGAQGSDLTFNSSTTILEPPMTKNMTMQCLLVDSASPSNGVVGRDLTHTALDVMYITSIVVTRNGTDIASISEHIPARSLVNSNRLQVSGAISPNTALKGYINLQWSYPKSDDAGNYMCVITGVDDRGHSMTYSKVLQIVETDITISSLAEQIGSLKVLNDFLRNQMSIMGSQMNLTKSQLEFMNAQISQLQSVRYTGGPCDVSHHCAGDLQCRDAVCGCPSGHYLVDDDSCAPQSGLGAACNTTRQCPGHNVECANNVCVCLTGFTAGQNTCFSSSLLSMRYTGGPCDASHPCAGDLQCQNGKCACPSDQFLVDDDSCAPQEGLGASCNISDQCRGYNVQCVNNVCSCEHGFTEGVNTCFPTSILSVRYTGGPCDYTHHCAGNLRCEGGVCGCPSGQYLVNDDTCVPGHNTVDLGASCNSSDQCTGCNVECSINVCSCESGFEVNHNTCIPSSALSVHYTGGLCDASHQCAGDLQCQSGVCGCPTGKYLASYDSCSTQSTFHSSCTSSDQCMGNLLCDGSNCYCGSGYIYMGYYSKCIPNSNFISYNADNTSRSFTSPGYSDPGKYVNNLDIYYLITAPSGKRVTITIYQLETEAASDYVDVFNGDSDTATKLVHATGRDGSFNNKVYTSSGQYLYLHFHTDFSAIYKGFNINYIAVI